MKAQVVFPGPHHHSLARRMALWVIELSKFDIQYRLQTAIKGKIVVDFITEYTQSEGKGAKGLGL